MRLLSVLALVGCGGSSPATAPKAPAQPTVQRVVMPVVAGPVAALAAPAAVAAAPVAVVAAPAAPSPYVADVHSVRFTKNAIAYATPSTTADRAGVVAAGTRSRPTDARPAGDGCAARWIAIAPRGWVCEDALAPSAELPTPIPPTALDDDTAPTLGVYGVVRGAGVVAYASRDDAASATNGRELGRATSVRAVAKVAIAGEAYWLTSEGEYIAAASIYQVTASEFQGVALADHGLAVAWVHVHDHPGAAAVLRDEAGAATGEAGPRSRVAVREVSADGARVRITDTDWIARADLRMPSLAAPPAGVGSADHWMDVDLDEQVLVAYEGAQPVYATLVSTGRGEHATPSETAHITTKYRTADMNNPKQGEAYAVADVPWTMYYDGHFALHTSYWHDGFGDVRSHGCVNLAPRDARALYGWSSPDVPAGWIAVYGNEASPGSLVRIHGKHGA
jgi:lipoprotein-anchoring transpeptidase ErfK/SrfK